ncbi:MAG: cob(I)yrinic acid a,c-diamide adenosyltransferase [Solimonas sp.]
MGNRLSKIVTRTGDAGTTGLASGGRVAKTHPRVSAMGDLDELNSQLGVLLADAALPAPFRDALSVVQHRLFDVGGELAMPGHTAIRDEHVAQLEEWVAAFNAELPPLKDFVLPGGRPIAAQSHLARAVARRAERSLWAVHEAAPLNPAALRYLNRLSDLLFVISRQLARADGGREVIWQHA